MNTWEAFFPALFFVLAINLYTHGYIDGLWVGLTGLVVLHYILFGWSK